MGPATDTTPSTGFYDHRAKLFSVIVKTFADRAWKSRLHHDGSMYDGMFIVGIDAPDGQATYHYDIDPYWLMFDCRELPRAPKWDGHTPAQAIERIAGLADLIEPTVETCELELTWGGQTNAHVRTYECSRCGKSCDSVWGEDVRVLPVLRKEGRECRRMTSAAMLRRGCASHLTCCHKAGTTMRATPCSAWAYTRAVRARCGCGVRRLADLIEPEERRCHAVRIAVPFDPRDFPDDLVEVYQFRCSECSVLLEYDWRFCPNCGARVIADA